MKVAHDQSDGRFNTPVFAHVAFKTQNTEVSPARGEIRFSPLVN